MTTITSARTADPAPDPEYLDDPAAVEEFCERVLLNPARSRPVVGLTTRRDTHLLPVRRESVARLVGDRAILVVIRTGRATYELARLIGKDLVVFDGAMRIWRAPLRPDDDRDGHPLLWTDAPEAEVLDRLSRRLDLTRAWRPPPGTLPPRFATPESTRDRLVSAARKVRRRARTAVVTAERFAPFTSEEAFRAAVADSPVGRYVGADLTDHPPRAYVLAPGFLESCRRTGGISARRVVDVCADVICDRGPELHTVHGLSDGPATRQIVRDDGARAWRLYLQADTPAARRLHYWTLGTPGGRTFELTSISVHDI